jgi:MinD-like ATPase involved in chromosome partitioning or flagellar assembly
MSMGDLLAGRGQLRVVLGVSRSRVLPLRLAYEPDEQVRVVASCATASEALAVLERGEADAAVLDEDLHGLNRARLGQLLKARSCRVVLLSRQPASARWDGLSVAELHAESDPTQILRALQSPSHVEFTRHHGIGPATASPRGQSHPSATGKQSPNSIWAGPERGKSRVIGFWSGRGGAGKTTLALNCLALGGAVEPTVLVELETIAASLAAYLDDGRDDKPRRARSTLLELAAGQPRSAADWESALTRVLQPLGSYSPHARLICGIAHPEQRSKLSDPAAFTEALIGALRQRFVRVLLDIGSDPLGGESTEALVASTALGLCDQVLVVATPDRPSVHRTCMAVGEAGHRIDRQGVELVINRVEPKLHGDVWWISDAVGLPILSTLPADDKAQRRAVAAAVPVVRDPDSRLRRPLAELLEQLGSSRSLQAFDCAPRTPRRPPAIRAWGRLRTAFGFALGALGAPQ